MEMNISKILQGCCFYCYFVHVLTVITELFEVSRGSHGAVMRSFGRFCSPQMNNRRIYATASIGFVLVLHTSELQAYVFFSYLKMKSKM